MRVGLLTLGDLVTDPVTGSTQGAAGRHRSIVEQAVTAEAAGFWSIHVGEHHFCDYIVSAPPVILAAVGERTSTLRLSTGVTLGANLDPVRIAEDYATVDVLSGGRVEPVIGRGTYFPHTYRGFGQDATLAKAVFAEHLELLLRLWQEEDVTWAGQHRAPLDGMTTQPRPVQQPPPVWLGAGSSMESIDLAARLGLGLMLPTVFGSIEMFVPAVERYRERWGQYGHHPDAMRIGCCSHAHVAATDQQARRDWEPRYRAYMTWVADLAERSSGRPGVLGSFDFDRLITSTALCGSPAHVTERMGEIREALGLDTHLLMFDLGGLPVTEVLATIERTGADVLPHLS